MKDRHCNEYRIANINNYFNEEIIRNNITLILLMLMTILFGGIGCSSDSEESHESVIDGSVQNFSHEQNYLFAQRKLLESKLTPEMGWSSEARIVSRAPMYIPGHNVPSYYEYKILDKDQEAGYILVNSDNKDIPILEMSATGPTYNERFVDTLGNTNFIIVKTGNFDMVAISPTTKDILGAYGMATSGQIVLFDDEDQNKGLQAQIEEQYDRYVSNYSSIAVAPWRDAKSLAPIYSQYSQLSHESIEKNIERHYEEIMTSEVGPYFLKHKFSNGKYTPRWRQPRDNDNYPSGCASVAWAVALAYWHQFKGYRGLFNFTDLNQYDGSSEFKNTIVEDIIWELADDLDTYYGINPLNDSKYGMVPPWDIDLAVNFVQRKGYPMDEDNVHKEDIGRQDKWEYVREAIRDDRPAILYINKDEGSSFTVADHYVIVEGVKKYTEYFDEWAYFVNFGWGQSSTWVFDIKGDYNSHTNAGEFFIGDSYKIYIPYKPLTAMYMAAINTVLL